MFIREDVIKQLGIPENVDVKIDGSTDGTLNIIIIDNNISKKLAIKSSLNGDFSINKIGNDVIINTGSIYKLSEDQVTEIKEAISDFPYFQSIFDDENDEFDNEEDVDEDVLEFHLEITKDKVMMSYNNEMSIISSTKGEMTFNYNIEAIEENGIASVKVKGLNFDYDLTITDNGTTTKVIENDLIIYDGASSEFNLSDFDDYISYRVNNVVSDIFHAQFHDNFDVIDKDVEDYDVDDIEFIGDQNDIFDTDCAI